MFVVFVAVVDVAWGTTCIWTKSLVLGECRDRAPPRWSMELDEIDFARAGAPDVGSPRKRKVPKEAEDPSVKPFYL